jgi:CheY-like chemotaxis protein
LYIEDNKYNADLIINILRKKYNDQVDLDIAETGEIGLSKLKTTKYNLILLDYLLPDFNGDVVLKRALEYGYISDTKNIILTTAYVDPMLTKKVSNIGVSKFLFKPISIRELFGYIDGVT